MRIKIPKSNYAGVSFESFHLPTTVLSIRDLISFLFFLFCFCSLHIRLRCPDLGCLERGSARYGLVFSHKRNLLFFPIGLSSIRAAQRARGVFPHSNALGIPMVARCIGFSWRTGTAPHRIFPLTNPSSYGGTYSYWSTSNLSKSMSADEKLHRLEMSPICTHGKLPGDAGLTSSILWSVLCTKHRYISKVRGGMRLIMDLPRSSKPPIKSQRG